MEADRSSGETFGKPLNSRGFPLLSLNHTDNDEAANDHKHDTNDDSSRRGGSIVVRSVFCCTDLINTPIVFEFSSAKHGTYQVSHILGVIKTVLGKGGLALNVVDLQVDNDA